MERLVNFLIAGVQKGGTTSLTEYLRQHTEISLARRKEVHFFDQDAYFGKTPRYKKYHARFDSSGSAVVRGEATPIYTYWPEALRRIWEYNPQMRLIVLLRNPILRAWSHWKMQVVHGHEMLDFSNAIRVESERTVEALPHRHRAFSYVDRGFYGEQIRNIRRFFPARNVLFLKSELFFASPQETLQRVCDFLLIDRHRFDCTLAHNVGVDRGLPGEADQRYLLDRFRYDILQTEQMLDWDCRDWLRCINQTAPRRRRRRTVSSPRLPVLSSPAQLPDRASVGGAG